MRALISGTVFTVHAEILASADPGVEWLRIGAGGTVVDAAGDPVPGVPAPDVAFASADMLYDGVVRPFFELLERSPALAWVQSATAGVDHPAYRALLERGVRLTASHENRIGIAEYVLGAVLREFQRADEWVTAQRAKEWRHHEFREVRGTTWLIVGLGAVGSEIAGRARAFGATTVGVRRHPSGHEPVDRMLTPDLLEPDAIPDAVADADVVVLAAPGTAETEHLVGAAFLARMRDGSVLVNIARGSLVDEDALLAALDRGRPAAAVLDVFSVEPLPSTSPLWTHPRVVVTPHNAAGGTGRHARNTWLFVANLAAFRAGEPLANEVRLEDLPAT